MSKKETLANRYIELRKQFDGEDFKPGLTHNQIWYLVQNFKVVELEDKIAAVERAIEDRAKRLKIEAYYETEAGQAFKAEITSKIEAYQAEYKNTHDELENWIIGEINRMVPGNWTASLHIGYKSATLEIGLVNRDPERKFKMQFGHDFTIYFDSYNYGMKSPRFQMNYGTLGAFNIFDDETRPIYLQGLATISNDKEWLQLLMAKLIEYTQKANKISEERDSLNAQLNNPF